MPAHWKPPPHAFHARTGAPGVVWSGGTVAVGEVDAVDEVGRAAAVVVVTAATFLRCELPPHAGSASKATAAMTAARREGAAGIKRQRVREAVLGAGSPRSGAVGQKEPKTTNDPPMWWVICRNAWRGS